MERTINVLQEYLKLIKQFKVDRYRVVATSAVREAANAAFSDRRFAGVQGWIYR